MDNNFNMTFEESQDYIAKRGFDIPWNDCDVFIDEREIIRTVGNVLKWADKTMIEKACEYLRQSLCNTPIFEHDEDENPVNYVCASCCDSVEEFIGNFRQAMEE